MANMNFDKSSANKSNVNKNKWKIIIADDEEDVHVLTKTVLSNFEYKGKAIEFISTYNEKETISALKQNNDVAMILLDVVMESDDTGLTIARRIREELNNNIIQIILRTGQPGSAPETEVVIDYAINDYKEKTELTSKKLITTIVTALRSYGILKSLEASKQGLEQIIDSSENIFQRAGNIFDHFSSKLFNQGVLSQLVALLKLNHDAVLVEHIDSLTIERNNDLYSIINAAGQFESHKEFETLNQEIKDLILQANKGKKSIFKDKVCVGYLELEDDHSNIIYISNYDKLRGIDRNLIEVFFKHTNISLNNLKLREDVFSTQKVLIEVLGQVVEKRYVDDPKHIKRVAKMSYILAKQLGLDEEDARILEIVSPMHDVGKIGISDDILLKPGKLTNEEFQIMKTHSTIGYDILKGTNKETLDIAALVSYEHHEKWDGTGYPRGLKGKEISIYGRITGIVDVFDALANKRCYKDAWVNSDIKNYIQDMSGTQFDPEMVSIMIENFDVFIEVQDKYKSDVTLS